MYTPTVHSLKALLDFPHAEWRIAERVVCTLKPVPKWCRNQRIPSSQLDESPGWAEKTLGDDK